MTMNLPDHTRRMAGLVNRPGGITVSEAVTAAEANLATIRDRGLEEISTTLSQIYAIGERLKSSNDPAPRAALYELSNVLVGVSAVFGLASLGNVAFSLCSLLDRLRSAGWWSMPSVQIHLDSLRLVHGGTVGPDGIAAMAVALRQVVERVPTTQS